MFLRNAFSVSNSGSRKLCVSTLTGRRFLSSDGKERMVILGSGWGGFRLARDLDKKKYDVTIISPRNHFLFTPLLPSTTVGSLEFRCVQEPVRTIKGVHYIQAAARNMDFEKKIIHCEEVYESREFDVDYDKLVIAVGTKSNTFSVPGIASVEENIFHSPTGTNRHNVFFLKQLENARAIRNRIIECFERVSSPFVTDDEKKRLLTFVIVGGGPTSIEFSSELDNFLKYDVSRWYPELSSSYEVVVIEASDHLLGSFDESLIEYVEKTLRKRNVNMMIGESVKEVKDDIVVLNSGREIPFGICVWSTGNAALDFVKKSGLSLSIHNRILVDAKLRVDGKDSVYAIGDCAVSASKPLALLAQVANQQGAYLAFVFNRGIDIDGKDFEYVFLGSMAQLGLFKAVVDFPNVANLRGPKVKGILAFLAWRVAYWTYSVSITNKILIPMYWFKSFFFGRDISKF